MLHCRTCMLFFVSTGEASQVLTVQRITGCQLCFSIRVDSDLRDFYRCPQVRLQLLFPAGCAPGAPVSGSRLESCGFSILAKSPILGAARYQNSIVITPCLARRVPARRCLMVLGFYPKHKFFWKSLLAQCEKCACRLQKQLILREELRAALEHER